MDIHGEIIWQITKQQNTIFRWSKPYRYRRNSYSYYCTEWSAASIPTGFLECNGAAVSRSTYSALFAIIGTTYGAGDGSSTFLLPDLQEKVAIRKSGTTSFRFNRWSKHCSGNWKLLEDQQPMQLYQPDNLHLRREAQGEHLMLILLVQEAQEVEQVTNTTWLH
jgi:hypothetical protein